MDDPQAVDGPQQKKSIVRVQREKGSEEEYATGMGWTTVQASKTITLHAKPQTSPLIRLSPTRNFRIPIAVADQILNAFFRRGDQPHAPIDPRQCLPGTILCPVTFAYVWPSLETIGGMECRNGILKAASVNKSKAPEFLFTGLPYKPSPPVDIERGITSCVLSRDEETGRPHIRLVCQRPS